MTFQLFRNITIKFETFTSDFLLYRKINKTDSILLETTQLVRRRTQKEHSN